MREIQLHNINKRLYNFYHNFAKDKIKDIKFYLTKAEIYNHSTLQRCIVEFKYVLGNKVGTIKIDRSRNFVNDDINEKRFYSYLLFYYCIYKCYEKLVSILNSNKLDPFMGRYEIKDFIKDEFKTNLDDDETGIMYEESYICSEYMQNKINDFINKY